jgi:hypothetical protein
MKHLRSVFVMLAIGALVGFVAQEASAQKKKGKFAFGKVTEISATSITVEAGKDKTKKTFKLTSETKYFKGGGKGKKPEEAKHADIKVGSNVFIATAEGADDTATRVSLFMIKKKDA